MDKPLALSIDLGGTQLRAALIDASGRILKRAALPTDISGPKAVIGQILRLTADICTPDERASIAGCGVAAPGPLDSETGTVIDIHTLPGWHNVPLREQLQMTLGLPVLLENDAIAAAYGEWTAGAGAGTRDMVYVTVSTGIGGGVIADGRVLRGRRGMAGHAGHMILAIDGPRCDCGANGCFEALASGTALARQGRDAVHRHPDSSLALLAGPDITAETIASAARQGDALALSLIASEAKRLGTGFASLIHLFSPERLIMGGGVANAFDLMADEIRSTVQQTVMEPFRDVMILPSSLGGNAGLTGAAALVLGNQQMKS